MTTDLARHITESRNRAISAARPGIQAAHELARVTDEAVFALAETAFAGLAHRWCVLATGSYGAKRLLPCSDIDLLVLVQKRTRESDAAAKRLLYPLWDAGLEVGHAVRTPAEQRSACKRDLQTLTALLPARVIAGDRALGEEAQRVVVADARARRAAITRALATRLRTGTPFDLWPDLKNGAGGQRDIDELEWRHVLFGEPVPDLSWEQEVLCSARWKLHRATGRGTSTITPEHSHIASEDVHRALGRVAATLSVRRGELDASATDGEAWAPETFLDVFDRGEEAFDAVAYAALHGALDGFVPHMSSLMILRRPALGHRYTVGAHCVKAALAVSDVYDTDALARALCDAQSVPTVIAAALAHDAGKAVPGPGHASRSAEPAAHAAVAIVGTETAASDAAWLAREHLLLSTFAERADIDDEDVIASCAARIPRSDLLGQLYLLTAADHLAVGSGAWDAWHASLVQTLVRRVQAAFEGDMPLRAEAMRAEEVRAQAAAALANEPAALVALLRFPARALFDRDQAEAAEDARAVSRLAAAAHPETFETRVSPGPVSGTFSVRIASPWRPRFLEEIAGCCTLTGLDILDARLVADTGELTLASVIVRSYARTPILADTWTRLDRLLGRAYAGELDLPSRLTSALPAARPTSDLSLDWNLDDPVASVLHVVAEDRPGLLFSLAKAVHDAGLVVLSARAVVRESIAVDTLRLVGEDGAPIKTPGRLGHLSMRIRASLESR